MTELCYTKELPKGLDAYEFQHKLSPSRDCASLFHYIPLCNEFGKPLLTLNGKPDIQQFHWDEILPGEGSIHLEIGCGKGNFLEEFAANNPQLRVIGAEWDPHVAHFAARRLQRRSLKNAIILRGDVFHFLKNLVADSSLDCAHMYFPDPWPKIRHHKNRLATKDGFCEELLRVFKPGPSYFYWGTDHAEYNEAALESFASKTFIQIMEKNSAPPTQGIMTNFEKKYRKEGRPIYRSILQFHKD
jgi:tRNA (guanine-N7-)-methyltransferase